VNVSRTFGLIPAAGKSRRMGRPKLSLPWRQSTVLEHVIATVKQAGVEAILVVVGPAEHELPVLAKKAGADVLILPDDTAQMRDTIERGLGWLEHHFRPQPGDGWLLLPADHPCVEQEIVRQIFAARDSKPCQSIMVPIHDGRRGHPVWIEWRHVAHIRAMPRSVGLNAYLREHRGEVVEVPVATPSILWDLDTPEDYQRLSV
jgi:molybdenum cofactor cytidylyltransferase